MLGMLQDHLGSVRVVYDAAGTLLARTDYLPYGEELAAQGAKPAEQFTGQARDAEAGQDYFHARMYQPRTGRFDAVDPVFDALRSPQGWNRYAYARNTPLVATDASGLDPVMTTYCPPDAATCAAMPSDAASFASTSNSSNRTAMGSMSEEMAAGYHQYADDRKEQFWTNLIDKKVPTNRKYENEKQAVIAANPMMWLATTDTGWEWAKNIFYDSKSESFGLGGAFTSRDPHEVNPIDIQFNVAGDSNYRKWVGFHHTHPDGNPALTEWRGDVQYGTENGVAVFVGTGTQINGWYPPAWTGGVGRLVPIWRK